MSCERTLSSKIHVIRVTKEYEREWEKEKEMAKIFPSFMKTINPQIQDKYSQNPRHKKNKETTLYHNIIRLLKIGEKRKS